MYNKLFQEHLENNHFNYFINTDNGKNFLRNINCINIKKSERPDYILKDINGLQHGIEEIVLFSNHQNCKFFSTMNNIVVKAFKLLDEDNDIKDKYFINLICNEIDFSKKLNENQIAQDIYLRIKNFPNNSKEKTSYTFNNIFIEGIHNIFDFKTSNGISMKLIYSQSDKNFGGSPVISYPLESPIELIQTAINKKNLKYEYYKSRCTGTCNLLIIYDPFISKGLLFESNTALYEHAFYSLFDNVFLLELGGKIPIKSSILLKK